MLDASALLALLNDEPGGEAVESALPHAAMSAVNLSEVVAKLIEGGMPEEVVRPLLEGLSLDVHAFDADLAYATAVLRNSTRQLGLSLGDRACLALGLRLAAPVLTTDRAWADLDLEIEVRTLR